jgi:lon-related putative ATP-dependent protease
MAIKKLSYDQLRRKLSKKTLSFKTTETLKPLNTIIGQERALKAMELGLEINASGYNVFVTGMTGTGRTTIIKEILQDYAGKSKVPSDWCYVYDFVDPDSARALTLPPGKGKKFQQDMARLIETLQQELRRVFTGEHYENQKAAIINKVNLEKRKLLQELDEKAHELSLKIQPTSMGFQTVALINNEPLSQEDFNGLSPEEKKKIGENIAIMENEIAEALRVLARLDIQAQKTLTKLDRDVASFVVEQYVNDIKEDYKDYPQVIEHLKDVCRDIVDNSSNFLKELDKEHETESQFIKDQFFKRYRVNVVVDNSSLKGAPVIFETNPTYNNLFSRIEKYPVSGGYATDFTMIKAGSLLKANGGYLMADALEILHNPYVYDTLKRSLRNKQLRIEDVTELYGTISIVSLKPEPVPLKLKVVLFGWPRIYHLLSSNDEDFSKVFKVRADFDYETDSTNKALRQYSQFVKRVIDQEKLPEFDHSAVEEIIQYGHRLAGNQRKISLEFGQVVKIIQQAAFWAKKDKKSLVQGEHIKQAILEYENRHSLYKEKIQEIIEQNIKKITVHGEIVGEINALSVYSMGDFSFGKPSRVTAKTYIGSENLINIERKAGLTGKIHDKGVYILTGFFNSKFGEFIPISFSASLAFEQSYGRIDGDSASSTELYVLLSSLANTPIKQGIAVTGSVNQNGGIQAIGGVNEKIEGFFEVCKYKGLDGKQGVMIPSSNVPDLILKDDVLEAVKEEKFHIWSVDTVEDGLKLLTGLNAGKRGKTHKFTKNSLYERVEKRLRDFAERSEEYRKSMSDKLKKTSEKTRKKKGKSGSKKPGPNSN